MTDFTIARAEPATEQISLTAPTRAWDQLIEALESPKRNRGQQATLMGFSEGLRAALGRPPCVRLPRGDGEAT